MEHKVELDEVISKPICYPPKLSLIEIKMKVKPYRSDHSKISIDILLKIKK